MVTHFLYPVLREVACTMIMKIYIASDHAGFDLKKAILHKYPQMIDLGTDSDAPVDYPDFAQKLALKLIQDPMAFGVLICGSGSGVCIAANRFKHIRAVNCLSVEMARLARSHNDANVLCLGERLLDTGTAFSILDVFINTEFSGEERHKRRVEKMS